MVRLATSVGEENAVKHVKVIMVKAAAATASTLLGELEKNDPVEVDRRKNRQGWLMTLLPQG